MRAVGAFWLLLAMTSLAPVASAGLTQQQLESIGYDRKIGETLPGQLQLVDEDGIAWETGTLFGPEPTFLVFADYTCTTLCGVTVNALASALAQTSLHSASDYKIVVVGLDPKDSPRDAAAFRDRSIEAAQLVKARFLTGTPATVTALLSAAGLRIAYDAEHDQFAHPAVAVLVAGRGRIMRYLDPLGMTAFDLKLSLAEASSGRIGHLADRLFLLCYGWDATTGIYTLLVHRLLAAAGVLTVAAIGLTIWLLKRREATLFPHTGPYRGKL